MDSPTQMQDSDGILEIDTLKQFTIPKRKKAKKDLFENLKLDSREYQQDILHVIRLGYKDRESARHFSYSRPRLVHNDRLLEEYAEKKKRMRQDGYSEKELQDSYGFLHVTSEQEALKICRDGLRTGNSTVSCLGNPKMGVYLCKHADILTAEPLKARQGAMILLLKIIKGKAKMMIENRSGTPLEPSPNFDCHLLKTSNVDMSAASPQYIYECTQLYLYEYKDDADLSDRPRQIYPFAIVDFRFQGMSSREVSRLGPPVLQQQMKTSKKAGKKQWDSSKEGQMPSLVDSSESKKSRHKSGDSAGSRNPNQLSPSARRNGATVDKNGTQAAMLNDAVVWSGELYCGEVKVSRVQLVSLSLSFKPTGMRTSLSVDKKIPIANIHSQYLHNLKFPSYKTEQDVDGVRYLYAQLRPLPADSRAFKKFCDYLTESAAGVAVGLSNDYEIVMFPDCDASADLGFPREDVDSHLLHCVVVLKRPHSEQLKDQIEKLLQLPENADSAKTAVAAEGISSNSTDSDKVADGASRPSAETPTEADSDQTSDAAKLRDPRLRRKSILVNRTPKPDEAACEKPAVVCHSRLVMAFDDMSKLQDKSNIELARMIRLNRHGNTSSSQPSANESNHPVGIAKKVETSDLLPRRSPAFNQPRGPAPGPPVPLMPPGPPRPLLPSVDPGAPPGGSNRQSMVPDGVENHYNQWGRGWAPGNTPQQGPPARLNQFPGPPSNGSFGGGWNEPIYPPGNEFGSAQNRQAEMLSPRAWEELRKKGKGREMGPPRAPDPKMTGPPSEFHGPPARRNSDPRSAGQAGNPPVLDPAQQYMPDHRYGGYPGAYSNQDPSMGQPFDPRSAGYYGQYDPSRWQSGDPRSVGPSPDHGGHDGNRWMSDPRMAAYRGEQSNWWHSGPRHSGPVAEYPGHNSDWGWGNDPRQTRGDWSKQGTGFPASDGPRSGLLGDYPNPDVNYHSGEPAAEAQNHNSNRASDPRLARVASDPRWPADPRTLRPSRNSSNMEAGQSLDDQNRKNHSSRAGVGEFEDLTDKQHQQPGNA